MSKTHSGYQRKEHDHYETPPGPLSALLSLVELRGPIWEPAAGGGALAAQLRARGLKVQASDRDVDFLTAVPPRGVRDLVTNPPFRLATQFIERALELVQVQRVATVALLLPSDFDHAARRRHLFGNCRYFAGQVKLTRRIVWFQRADGKRPAPSEWHSWFVWSYDPPWPWVRYGSWEDADKREARPRARFDVC